MPALPTNRRFDSNVRLRILAGGLVVAALLGVTRPAPANAAPPPRPAPYPLIPLATLLAPATNQAPLVSPVGLWISFLPPVGGAMNLFVAPADSPEVARALTHRAGRGLHVFDASGNVLHRWTPDSRRILFPVDRDGDEKWNLYAINVATGEEKTLTDLPGVAVEFLRFADQTATAAGGGRRGRPGRTHGITTSRRVSRAPSASNRTK